MTQTAKPDGHKRLLPEIPLSWIIFVLVAGICAMRVTGQMDRDRFLAALGFLLGGQQITLASEGRGALAKKNGNGNGAKA